MSFSSVSAARPKRSSFKLSYDKKFTLDMGYIVPVMADEVVPGDIFKLSNAFLMRMQPLVAPVMHEITAYTHYFFVPYRIISDYLRDMREYPDDYSDSRSLLSFDWERFITGGREGNDDQSIPPYCPYGTNADSIGVDATGYAKGTLWDYFGFPIGNGFVAPTDALAPFISTYTSSLRWPKFWPQAAYNLIYNEYYRDENLQLKQPWYNNTVLRRAWRKDYFTSALPFQQRGAPPAMPLSGDFNVSFSLPDNTFSGDVTADPRSLRVYVSRGVGENTSGSYGGSVYNSSTISARPSSGNGLESAISPSVVVPTLGASAPPNTPGPASAGGFFFVGVNPYGQATAAEYPSTSRDLVGNQFVISGQAMSSWLNANNVVDASQIGTFTMSDFRVAMQLQRFLERNARAGIRYTEFLRAHFGVTPRDDRLNRPEFIGGTRTPLIISEVLQTSSSDDTTPQGNMAGHGVTSDNHRIGTYRAYEFGIIVGLMSIMPRATYQQGVNRQWLRSTRFDHYFPEFAHLSEQGVMRGELFFKGDDTDLEVFGFQGIYDEMRHKTSMVCGDFRDVYDYWHLGRLFSDTSAPQLNASFIECNPDKRIFAVPSSPGFLCWYSNIITAVRPLPFEAEPGFIDHF